MSILPKPTPAKPVPSKSILQISILYAVILIIFSVAQLFTFDEFMAFMASPEMGFPVGSIGLLVPVLIFSEVFGLAFLLRIALSPAFRWVSLGLSVLAAILWVFISSWIVFGYRDVATVGFLGTAVDLVPGFWAVCISIGLLLLSLWSAWGLWPGKRRPGAHRKVK